MRTNVALLVGGTDGIGRATAVKLAARGVRVVLVGRNAEKGERAAAEVRSRGGAADVLRADVSLMAEVRRLAEEVKSRYSRLDLLIHSADVLRLKREKTAEGLEVAFATNYLSRFLLNHLLLDLLKAGAPARVLHVAAAGFPGKLDLANVPPDRGTSSFTGHNIGQRANDVYGVEPAERLRDTGVTVNIMNPGMVATDIRRSVPGGGALARAIELVSKPVTKTPGAFAERVLHLALAPELAGVSGALFGPSGKRLRVRAAVLDPALRRGLWRASERLVGLGAARDRGPAEPPRRELDAPTGNTFRASR